MVGCECKAAGRSHSGLQGFFPLLPGSPASFLCACAREAGYGDLPEISCGRAFRELRTLLGEIGSTARFIM